MKTAKKPELKILTSLETFVEWLKDSTTPQLRQDAHTFLLWWATQLFVQARLQSRSTGKVSKSVLAQCQLICELLLWAACVQPQPQTSRLSTLLRLQARVSAYRSTTLKSQVLTPSSPDWMTGLSHQWTAALDQAYIDITTQYQRYCALGLARSKDAPSRPVLANCLDQYCQAWQIVYHQASPLEIAGNGLALETQTPELVEACWMLHPGWREPPKVITDQHRKTMFQNLCNAVETELFEQVEQELERGVNSTSPDEEELFVIKVQRIQPLIAAFEAVLQTSDLDLGTRVSQVKASRTLERLTNHILAHPQWYPGDTTVVDRWLLEATPHLSSTVVRRLSRKVAAMSATWSGAQKSTAHWFGGQLQNLSESSRPPLPTRLWEDWDTNLFLTCWKDQVKTYSPETLQQAQAFAEFLTMFQNTTQGWTELYIILHCPSNTNRWAELIEKYTTKLEQEVFEPITMRYLKLFQWAVRKANSPTMARLVVTRLASWVATISIFQPATSLGLATERSMTLSILDNQVLFYHNNRLHNDLLVRGQPPQIFDKLSMQDVLNRGIVLFKDRLFGVLASHPHNSLILGWTYIFETSGLAQALGFPLRHIDALSTRILSPVGLGRVDLLVCYYTTTATGEITNLTITPSADSASGPINERLDKLHKRVHRLLDTSVEPMLARASKAKREALLGFADLEGPRTVVIPHYLCFLSVATEINGTNTLVKIENEFNQHGQLDVVAREQLETTYLSNQARWWATSTSDATKPPHSTPSSVDTNASDPTSSNITDPTTVLGHACARRKAWFDELTTICTTSNSTWRTQVDAAFDRYERELYLQTFLPDAMLVEHLMFYVMDPPEFRNRTPFLVRWHRQSALMVDLHTILHNTLLTFNVGQIFRLTQEHSVVNYRHASDLNLLLFFLLAAWKEPVAREESCSWEKDTLNMLYKLVLLELTGADWVSALTISLPPDTSLKQVRYEYHALVMAIQQMLRHVSSLIPLKSEG